MSAQEIDWTKIRDVDDCIVPDGFAVRDDGSSDGERLAIIDHGRIVVDRVGERFRVMGYGSVQGSAILRDRYRRMFHADIDTRLKVVSA